MSLQLILDHPTFNKALRFLDTTPKREKTYRLVAYLSRFLSYYLQRQGFSPEAVATCISVKNNVSTIRKAMRFGKPLWHIRDASKVYRNKNLAFRWLQIFRNLFYAGYLTCDGLVLLKAIGIINKGKLPNVGTWAARFWLLGVISSLLGGIQKVVSYNKFKRELRQEEKDLDKLKAVNENLYVAKRKIVWDLLDGFIALNMLKYLNFTEGDIGLAGVITSLMGLTDMWRATA